MRALFLALMLPGSGAHAGAAAPKCPSTQSNEQWSAEAGIGRFSSGGKCGYFRAGSFKVIVPPTYGECMAFREGTALACRDCVRYCRAGECADSTLVGGRGFVFDIKGRLRRQFSLPKLEEVCGRVGVEEVSHLDGSFPFLKCNAPPGFEL